MKKVAVTGGLSSGKSSVCRILESLGAYVVSADEVVHQILSSNTALSQQIIDELGSDVIKGDQLDRAKIADKVFSNPEKLQALEKILHPAVLDEIEKCYQRIKDQKKYTLFVAEIPLLFESQSELHFDAIVAVVADPALCQSRFAKNRDAAEYKRRMARQMPQTEKAARADYTITNNGSLEELRENVIKFTKEFHSR